jgi:hypothetical protein
LNNVSDTEEEFIAINNKGTANFAGNQLANGDETEN